MLEPRVTVWLAGDAEIVKLPEATELTTRVTVVEWVNVPSDPVMVSV